MLFQSATAQKVSLRLHQDSILLGAQGKLSIDVSYPIDAGRTRVQWPVIPDTLPQGIEVLAQSKVDTLLQDEEEPYVFIQSKTLTITSFDSGFVVIEPLPFVINGDSIFSEPTLLEVVWPQLEGEGQIKDIKEIAEVNYSILDWLWDRKWWILAALGAILLAVVAYLLYKRRKTTITEVIEPSKPKEPAHVIALRELDAIKERSLWKSGQVKTYHSELSDVVRTYIEDRFMVHALEQTTREILRDLAPLLGTKDNFLELQHLLELADAVKFAKHQPDAMENARVLQQAYRFVESTKVNPEADA